MPAAHLSLVPLTGNKVGNKSVPTLRWSGEGRMDEYVKMAGANQKRKSKEELGGTGAAT